MVYSIYVRIYIYTHFNIHVCCHTDIIIEGPSDVTYIPGLTPLPIELTCNVTGLPLWRVNGVTYTLTILRNGALPGHNATGTNILIDTPVNNTEYVCVSSTNDGDVSSDPANLIIAGEYMYVRTCMLYNNKLCSC